MRFIDRVRTIVALTAVALAVGALPAVAAEPFPTRPLTMIVAWPPGSASDLASRLIAKHAEKFLGQPIVTTNKVGADGEIAWSETLKAKPDGYTLTVVNYDILTSQAKGSKITYDSFDYLLMFTFQPLCMYVRKDSPYKTLQDLVGAAKAKPGQINIATTGFGGFLHQGVHLVERKYGVSFNIVPYKGTSEILTAELGGQVDVDLNLISITAQYVKAGTLRALLCFTQERLPDYPDVPTITELGISDAPFYSWRTVAVPKGVPADVREQLVQAFTKAYNDPEYLEAAKKANLDVKFMTPAEVVAFLGKQYPIVRDTVKALGYTK
jgi:tripartite-type tricarboxylate transporter receptor subunit TctC